MKRAQLDTLHINFKIDALSETAINDHDTAFNIPGYNVEQDFRPKRRGGGVALYIANSLQILNTELEQIYRLEKTQILYLWKLIELT